MGGGGGERVQQTCRSSVADVCQMEFAPGELVQEPGVDSPEQNVILGQTTFQLGNVLQGPNKPETVGKKQ